MTIGYYVHGLKNYLAFKPQSTDAERPWGWNKGEGRGMRRSALDSDKWSRWRPLVVVGGADGGPGQRHWGGVGGTACRGKTIADRPMRLYGEVG